MLYICTFGLFGYLTVTLSKSKLTVDLLPLLLNC
jgi:hypothetical protein